MKEEQCPKCGDKEYSWYYIKPGEGDPSKTYCVCNKCGHEFDGVTEND